MSGRRPVGAGEGFESLVGLVATGSWRVSSGRVVLEQEHGRVSDRSSVLPARAVRNRGALFLLCSSARHERR